MAVTPKLSTQPDGANALLIQASDWNALLNHRLAVANVLDYGADPTGVTDSTAAFDAAIAAIPTTGGTVEVPTGIFAINLTINRPKIRLVGNHIGRPSTLGTPAGLVAFDPSLPVLTLSNDTQLNEGIVLDTLEFNGRGTASYGLKMDGGTYSCCFNNITIQSFTKKCLWIRSGTTGSTPVAFLHFNNLLIQPPSAAATLEHCILIEQINTNSFAEAIFFNNVRLSGTAFGYALELAGCSNTWWTNAWFQVQDGHGVLLTKPFTIIPHLNGNGLLIDSDSGSHTLVRVAFGAGAGDYINNYVNGSVGIDGYVDLNGTLRLNGSTSHPQNETLITYPRLAGSTYLVDAADPYATDKRIYGETSTGRVTIQAATEINLNPGSGMVQAVSVGGATVIYRLFNSTGASDLYATAANLFLKPFAGGYAQLQTDTIKFGASTALTLLIDAAVGLFKFGSSLIVPNGNGYKCYAADGTTALSVASINSSNNLFFGQGATGTFTTTGASVSVYQFIGGTTKTELQATYLIPFTDNDLNFGLVANRWKEVFAVAGVINTSDAREKQDFAPPDDALLDAWAEVEFTTYRWKAAVAAKGDAARTHVGVIAQQIEAVFRAHGLDPFRYGLLCYDEWEASETVDPADPTGTRAITRPAGNRYSVRPDQCLMLEAALHRRATTRLEARLAALEKGTR